MYEVSMLRCGEGSLYTGITDDVSRQLAAHRSGKSAKYTRVEQLSGKSNVKK